MSTITKKIVVLIGFLSFLLLFPSNVNATAYYVATNGNNSNPGTLSQPWLTIQYAADNVAPGDVVYIRAGTYSTFKANVSGTSGNPITFRNYAGELPVIDGNWTGDHGVEIRGVSYITIDGLKFYEISGDGVHIEGSELGPSYAADPVYDIIIRNCQIDGTSNAGIYCAGLIMGQTIPVNEYRVFNITIENNDITRTNYTDGGNECISLGGGTDGFTIRNNYVHDSEQYGIDAKFGAINGQIYGNVVHDMEKHGIYLDTNSRTIDNVDVYDNFVYDCGGNGICLTRESRRLPKVPNLRNIRIYDNVIKWCYRGILCYILNAEDPFTGDFKNITIVNNTCHNNMNPSGGTDNRSIKIIDLSKIANHEGWIVANNLTSVNPGPALINSSGADWIVTNNVNSATDAPYVDAANLDFHLVSGSVANNAGNATHLCKNTDYDGVTRGTPPECGAFEFLTIPNAPSSLSAAAVSSSQINISWTDNAGNEDGFKIERKTGAGSYSEIDQVGANVTSYNNTGLSASTTYTYRVRAYNTAGNSSYSNEANATTQSSLPSPWQNQDIGAVGAAGSAGYSSGVFTVDGTGADVWGTADEFHYVYQQVGGDVEIKMRVPSQEAVHNWAKSGVMIRETLAAGSKNAFIFITPGYGFRFQSRDATDGTSVSTDGGALNASPNNWVRLVRSGNSITAYKSSNGTSWTQVGTAVTISMTTSIYVGMAVCSHSDGVLCTTEFDNVGVIGGEACLLNDDFEDGNDNGWTVESGTWNVVTDGGKWYSQTSTDAEYRTSCGETTWTNYSFEVDVKPVILSGNCGNFINFRYADNNNTYRVIMHGYSPQLRLVKKVGGSQSDIETKTYTWNTGTVYNIKIEAVGTSLKVYVNDNLELNATDGSLSSGKIALATWKTSTKFDNVLVDQELAKRSNIEIAQEKIGLSDNYLIGNYPNPFNPATRIQFSIPSSDDGKKVVIRVFNVLGRQVSTLVNEYMSSGVHEVDFNATDLTSGIYIIHLQIGDRILTHRSVLIK